MKSKYFSFNAYVTFHFYIDNYLRYHSCVFLEVTLIHII